MCGGGPRRPSRRRRMTTPPTTTLAPTTATTTTRFDRRTELGDCSPPFPFILSRIWKMQLWYPREMHLYQHKASSLRLAAVFLSPSCRPWQGTFSHPCKHPCKSQTSLHTLANTRNLHFSRHIAFIMLPDACIAGFLNTISRSWREAFLVQISRERLRVSPRSFGKLVHTNYNPLSFPYMMTFIALF